MKDLIQRYVTSCDLCQKNKSWHQKPYGAPQLPDVPTTTWESVSLDFCGPFPRSKNGNELVLVVSDRLSRLQYLIPCPLAVTAILTAELFLKYVFRHHGLPKQAISDRGPQFVSIFWKELWRLLNTTVSLSALTTPSQIRSRSVLIRLFKKLCEALSIPSKTIGRNN